MLDPRPYLFGQHESLFCIDCGIRAFGVYPYSCKSGFPYVVSSCCDGCGDEYGWFRHYKYRHK